MPSLAKVTLVKGANASLSKIDPGLTKIHVGLGWGVRETSGEQWDLDACAFLLSATGKVLSDADFIFYNNLQSADGTVVHSGDVRDGAVEGDDEVLCIDLAGMNSEVAKVAISVTIHSTDERPRNFGMVKDAFVRILNNTTKEELVRYDLSEDFSVETALIFADIYRHNGEWKVRAIGEGFQEGLEALCRHYGVSV
jgi:tellurium resistance protein TerD